MKEDTLNKRPRSTLNDDTTQKSSKKMKAEDKSNNKTSNIKSTHQKSDPNTSHRNNKNDMNKPVKQTKNQESTSNNKQREKEKQPQSETLEIYIREEIERSLRERLKEKESEEKQKMEECLKAAKTQLIEEFKSEIQNKDIENNQNLEKKIQLPIFEAQEENGLIKLFVSVERDIEEKEIALKTEWNNLKILEDKLVQEAKAVYAEKKQYQEWLELKFKEREKKKQETENIIRDIINLSDNSSNNGSQLEENTDDAKCVDEEQTAKKQAQTDHMEHKIVDKQNTIKEVLDTNKKQIEKGSSEQTGEDNKQSTFEKEAFVNVAEKKETDKDSTDQIKGINKENELEKVCANIKPAKENQAEQNSSAQSEEIHPDLVVEWEIKEEVISECSEQTELNQIDDFLEPGEIREIHKECELKEEVTENNNKQTEKNQTHKVPSKQEQEINQKCELNPETNPERKQTDENPAIQSKAVNQENESKRELPKNKIPTVKKDANCKETLKKHPAEQSKEINKECELKGTRQHIKKKQADENPIQSKEFNKETGLRKNMKANNNHFPEQGREINKQNKLKSTTTMQVEKNQAEDESELNKIQKIQSILLKTEKWCKKPAEMSAIEWEEEEITRKKRKKNLKFIGLNLRFYGTAVAVRDFIRTHMGLDSFVDNTTRIGDNLLVEFRSFYEKMNILKHAEIVEEYGVWICSDLTRREEEVQEWLKEQAELLRKAHLRVQIRHLKLIIDNTRWIWDDLLGDLMPDVSML